jgi:superfamily II DNA or RNA helicase
MKVEVIDPIISHIPSVIDVRSVLPCLMYRGEYWTDAVYGKKKTTYTAYMIDRRNRTLLSGLLPRIHQYCNEKGLPFELVNKDRLLYHGKKGPPGIYGKNFWANQEILIKSAISNGRGIIVSPTGTGKSLVMLGIASALPDAKVLILCRKISIIKQLQTEMKEQKLRDIIVLGGGNNRWCKTGTFVLSTVQTFIKQDPRLYSDYFDIIFVDEVHQFSDQCEKIMKHLLSPIRIGFTATLPTDAKKLLAIEGNFGKVIGETTVNEAAELGILAKPKIKLLPVPYKQPEGYSYQDIYNECIVNNKGRNELILEQVRSNIEEGLTNLIMVTHIAHGEVLVEMARTARLPVIFLQGATDNEVREKIRILLSKQQIKAVITTSIFREGIDIPSLGCVLMAFGGKSPIATVQALGRALRVTDTKKEALVIDFLDPQKHIAQHAIHRISIYVKNGWL